MSPRRHVSLAAGLLALLSGCAQSGTLLSQRTTVGSLKTSVSHLEHENQQLRREVATLKDENRQIENRLVQEETQNGDLSARLDDARALLGQTGLEGGTSQASNGADPGPSRSPRTLPAGQSSRKRRKTPFAQIPGRIDTLPPADTGSEQDGSSNWGAPISPGRNDPGATSRLDRSTLWLPVARGATQPTNPRR